MGENIVCCKGCGSEDIIIEEFMGIGDIWLLTHCNICQRMYHRFTKKQVTAITIIKQYETVEFTFADGSKGINFCRDYINQEDIVKQ